MKDDNNSKHKESKIKGSNMKKMTINRALAEVKLIEKRIEGATESLKFASTSSSGSDAVAVSEFKENSMAGMQRIKALISNRSAIKSSISLSNAVTVVDICGKKMKVSEAIERKNSIEMDESLHTLIKNTYYRAVTEVEQNNASAKHQANEFAKATMGGEGADASSDAYKTLAETFYENNKIEVCACEGAELVIASLRDDIDEFKMNVDYVLTESNIKTEIEVDI